jgi:DNA ligase-1
MLPCPSTNRSILTDDRYGFEPVLEGHRLLVCLKRGKVTLYTRYGHDCTSQYPELCNVPVDDDVILDGEVVLFDEQGRMDFPGLMSRYRLTRAAAVRSEAGRRPVRYIAFDLLRYRGRDCRACALEDRRRLLRRIMTDNAYYHPLPYCEGHGEELFAWVQAYRLPGLIAKRKDSPYVEGRSDAWLKIAAPENPISEPSPLTGTAGFSCPTVPEPETSGLSDPIGGPSAEPV